MPKNTGGAKTLSERCSEMWNEFLKKEQQLPSRVTIPSDHIRGAKYSPVILESNVHYFTVRINEIFLFYKRKLWKELDPMVFVVSEFIYNKKKETVPFIVGPAMLENLKKTDISTTRMIFCDTKVAGFHPYKGGDLTLSVMLCQVARNNDAKKWLRIIESAANALDYATALGSYLKVAGVVIDGLEELAGIKGITPLIGLRKEFDPDAGDDLKQSYFALINAPESGLDDKELWVVDNKLLKGKDFESAKPYREADYVLYSIRSTTRRSDVDRLPFSGVWERVQQEAMKPDDNSWERAKADLISLYQTMYLSPDLTTGQANDLKAQYIKEMTKLHEDAKQTFPKAVPVARREAALTVAEEDLARLVMKKKLKESVQILEL